MTRNDARPLRVGVVGAGLMGSGIATKLAVAGVEVRVWDSSPQALSRVPTHAQSALDELQAGRRLTPVQATQVMARIQVCTTLQALAGVDWVIEAVPEVLAIKQALYAQLEAVLADDVVLASTTSGIAPAELVRGMRCPQRFVVAHFWNPPHLIPLVEVVPAPGTLPAVLTQVMQGLVACGCKPVLLRRPVAGFIGNRIQFAVLREALHLLAAGVADADVIDLVVRETLGRRYRWVGPLEGADAGGLHTFTTIASQLWPQLATGQDMVSVWQACVDRGETGRATGQGVYHWDAPRQQRYAQARLRMLQDGDVTPNFK